MTPAIENFATHVSWLHEQTPGMLARRSPELVMTDCGLPCDTFNVVCCTRRPDIAAVLEHFAANRRPFSWWVEGEDGIAALLREHGLTAAESEVAMAVELRELQPVPQPPAIARVRTIEQLRAFARVTAANWDPPDENVIEFYERVAPAALRPDCPLRFYLGYAGEVPVATSEVTVTDIAGVYNVSTLREYRGRGFGTAMTVMPLIEARSEGIELAVLQASGAGESMYRRIGFREYGRITEYQARVK